MSIKIVYNTCYGGFGLSKKAKSLYKLKLKSLNKMETNIYKRHDPILVDVVEELKEEAYGKYAQLKIKTIPLEYKDHYGRESIVLNKTSLIREKCKNINLNEVDKNDCVFLIKDIMRIVA